jgi:hypothetical protein
VPSELGSISCGGVPDLHLVDEPGQDGSQARILVDRLDGGFDRCIELRVVEPRRG